MDTASVSVIIGDYDNYWSVLPIVAMTATRALLFVDHRTPDADRQRCLDRFPGATVTEFVVDQARKAG